MCSYGMIAINVAVFLFELASPEAVPGVLATSLPSLLGAKVNVLIEAGEWWRLVTPTFLVGAVETCRSPPFSYLNQHGDFNLEAW